VASRIRYQRSPFGLLYSFRAFVIVGSLVQGS
jgi:hypothetical protein